MAGSVEPGLNDNANVNYGPQMDVDVVGAPTTFSSGSGGDGVAACRTRCSFRGHRRCSQRWRKRPSRGLMRGKWQRARAARLNL